jgi:hypothetical protein
MDEYCWQSHQDYFCIAVQCSKEDRDNLHERRFQTSCASASEDIIRVEAESQQRQGPRVAVFQKASCFYSSRSISLYSPISHYNSSYISALTKHGISLGTK